MFCNFKKKFTRSRKRRFTEVLLLIPFLACVSNLILIKDEHGGGWSKKLQLCLKNIHTETMTLISVTVCTVQLHPKSKQKTLRGTAVYYSSWFWLKPLELFWQIVSVWIHPLPLEWTRRPLPSFFPIFHAGVNKKCVTALFELENSTWNHTWSFFEPLTSSYLLISIAKVNLNVLYV